MDKGFQQEVRDEIDHLTRCHSHDSKSQPDSSQQLHILKKAIRNAAKYIRKKNAQDLA